MSGMSGFRRPRLVSGIAVGLLIVILFLAPVLYAVMLAFETPKHFLVSPTTPGHPTLGNFGKAWSGADLGTELLNTVLYSVTAALLTTVLGLVIAFPIARRLVRGHGLLYVALVIGLFLPFSVIPLFAEARTLHLYDSRLGYILFHVEPGLPLAVVLLVAFISAIPKELDEAAWVEGSGYLPYMVRVVIPLTRPALAIAFLYALLGVWNDIIGPVVLLANPSLFPVARGVDNFYTGSNANAWTYLAAAIVIVSLPVVVLFAASQRQIIRARFAGSVKG